MWSACIGIFGRRVGIKEHAVLTSDHYNELLSKSWIGKSFEIEIDGFCYGRFIVITVHVLIARELSLNDCIAYMQVCTVAHDGS